jgi:hypothetical protein
MAIGKKRTVVNIDSYLDTVDRNNRGRFSDELVGDAQGRGTINIGGVETELPPRAANVLSLIRKQDPIRILSDKIWVQKDNDVAYGDEETIPLFTIVYEEEPVEDGAGLLPTTSQVIKLMPNQQHPVLHSLSRLGAEGITAESAIFDDVVWNQLITIIKTRNSRTSGNQEFLDCPFKYSVPFDHREAKRVSIDNSITLVADIDSEYNFYVGDYEKLSTRPGVPETLLPCMYSFISEKESEYKDEDNSWYNRHISLMNTIEGVFKDVTNKKGEKIGEKDTKVSDYFKAWGRTYRQSLRQTRRQTRRKLRPLSAKFKNIIFSQVDVDFLTSFARKKESFPMHVDIKFSTALDTQFVEALREAELGATLMSHIKSISGDDLESYRGSNFVETRESLSTGLPRTFNEALYDAWDITDWWEDIGNMAPQEDVVTVGRNNCTETRIIDQCKPQLMSLLKILLLGKIRDLARESGRTPMEIFDDGKLAHSETVFYEIQKFKQTNLNEPVQRFFVPNSDKLRICNLIDTQVKYGVEYRYIIYAYQLVFGARYQYQLEEPEYLPAQLSGYTVLEDDGNSTIEIPRFRVDLEPTFKLVKVPYHETELVKIIDKPPVAPDVSIVPFRGRRRRVLFNLNAGVGDYKLIPEVISTREESRIRELERIQKVSKGDPINYVSDDPPRVFQVYRTDERPKSYRDFSGKARRRIPTKRRRTNLTAVSFIDRIRPNRKYYYTFRTVDVHDNMSYPSPVFEVEMVEEDGSVYLLTKAIEFEVEKTKVTSMPIDKHIYITPAFSHRVVNVKKTLANAEITSLALGSTPVDTSLDGDGTTPVVASRPNQMAINSAKQLVREDVVLGVAEEDSPWGRNFKFRFTSKSTGRKFDLNVKCRHVFNYDKDKSNT